MLEVVTRLFWLLEVHCSLQLRPGFSGWKFIAHWSYNQASVALLSPSDTKKQNSSFSSPSKIQQPKTNLPYSGTRKGQPPNRAHLLDQEKTPTTDRDCDSARRERKPRKSPKTRISAKSNMCTGHLHLVALKRQTSLVLLPLKKVERKEADL